jgi:hypothetical protein
MDISGDVEHGRGLRLFQIGAGWQAGFKNVGGAKLKIWDDFGKDLGTVQLRPTVRRTMSRPIDMPVKLMVSSREAASVEP